MVAWWLVYAVEGKNPLYNLLMVGQQGALLPVDPVVEGFAQFGNNLGLDSPCRGMGNLVKDALDAPSLLHGLVAAEGRAWSLSLGIAGRVHHGNKESVLGKLAIGKEMEAALALMAIIILAEGEAGWNVETHASSISWMMRVGNE